MSKNITNVYFCIYKFNIYSTIFSVPVLHVMNGAYSFVAKLKVAGVQRKLIMKANLIGPHENLQRKTVPGDIERLTADYLPGVREMMAKYSCTEDQATEVIPLLIRAAFATGAWVIQHESVEALRDFYLEVETWKKIKNPDIFFKVTNLVSVVPTDCSVEFVKVFFKEYFPSFPDYPDMGNFHNFVAPPITPEKVITGPDF